MFGTWDAFLSPNLTGTLGSAEQRPFDAEVATGAEQETGLLQGDRIKPQVPRDAFLGPVGNNPCRHSRKVRCLFHTSASTTRIGQRISGTKATDGLVLTTERVVREPQ